MNTSIDRIVLASNNTGKLAEFNRMFADSGLTIISQKTFNVSDAEETGLSFIENAILKARHACQRTGLPAIADDSGLAIDYLQGAPGIYSARYSGEHGNDEVNNQKVLDKLSGQPRENRGAQFICALAFMQHENDPTPVVCQARWQGLILDAPMGENGFGYDPLFWVEEKQCSSAQLPPEEKNRISHRAKALEQLLTAMTAQGYINT